MFRYGKIIDPNSKVTRSDRFAEMSKQQRLIEQKKQEIKAKFEERRKQEAEDALKKLANKASADSKVHKGIKSVVNSRIQSWKNDERWKKKSNVEVEQEASFSTNVFSNDGSFIDEFKKITQDGCKEEINEKEKSKANSGTTSSCNTRTSQSTSVSCSSSASSTNLSCLPVATPSSPSVNYYPVYPVPNNFEAFNHPVYPYHTMRNQQNHSIYDNTASTCNFNNVAGVLPPPPPPPPSLLPRSHILPADLIRQHGSNETSCENHLPSSSTNAISGSAITRTTDETADCSNLNEAIQGNVNDLKDLPEDNAICEDSFSEMKSDTSCNVSKSDIIQEVEKNAITGDVSHKIDDTAQEFNCNHNSFDAKGDCGDGNDNDNNCLNALPKKIIDEHDKELEKMTTIARIVADCGDHMEDTFLQRPDSAEELQFLTDKFSPPYIAYRHMVNKFRKDSKYNDDNIDKSSLANEENKFDGRNENYCDSVQTTTEQKSDQSSKSVDNEYRVIRKTPADVDSDSECSENEDKRKRKKRKSRWAPESSKVDLSYTAPNVPSEPAATSGACPVIISPVTNLNVGVSPANPSFQIGQHLPIGPSAKNPLGKLPGVPSAMISQVTRTDSALLSYAMQAYGKTNLTDEEWKTAEDHYKLNLLYQDLLRKRAEVERLNAAGKNKYEYDSDEDTEGGTWEHKLREQEMTATKLWADELTEKAKGKHHIGDFLPPDELERFMEKYDALKEGREPDLSDYKEYKLKQDNVGFQMLQKLGWIEGQGLGSDGSGMINPVNKAPSYIETHGLGIEKPDEVTKNDDEYDAYRKRMMLAYRFRPNPLNNPRRPYY